MNVVKLIWSIFSIEFVITNSNLILITYTWLDFALGTEDENRNKEDVTTFMPKKS